MPLYMKRTKLRKARYKPYPMADSGIDEFVQSGRTGRRNALANILDQNHGNTTTATLPSTLEKLTCAEGRDATTTTTAKESANKDNDSHAASNTETKPSTEDSDKIKLERKKSS